MKASLGAISRFNVRGGALAPTHLLYADDILFFLRYDEATVQTLKDVLRRYEAASGQIVNISKSFCVVGNTSPSRLNIITSSFGFSSSMDKGFSYLGAPVIRGRRKICFFEHLISRIEKKIASWKGKLLSFGGKLTLIKHVLSAVPVYTMMATNVPNGVIKKINTSIKNFLWQSREGEKRRHWIAWNKICTPIDEGGLGIQPLWLIQKAAIYKAAWQVFHGSSSDIWASFSRLKYKNTVWGDDINKPFFLKCTTRSSPYWKKIWSVFDAILEASAWMAGKGHIPFWSTRWCGVDLKAMARDNANISNGFQVSEVFEGTG